MEINIEASLGALMLETFLYGIYSVLFMICVYVVLQKNRVHLIFQVLGLAQYLAATADMAYATWLVFGKLMKGDTPRSAIKMKYLFFVTGIIFADTLLLSRCYLVWGRDKRVLIGPAILLIATAVCGYVFGSLSTMMLFPNDWAYLLMTFVLNISLTVLTASRIWWVARRARKSAELQHQYSMTLMILIESGFIYCLYMVVLFAVSSTENANSILEAGLIQIVGIMPTLILAQIALGRSAQDFKDHFSSTHSRNYGQTIYRTSMPQSAPSSPFSTKAAGSAIVEVSVTRSKTLRIDPHSDWSSIQLKELSSIDDHHSQGLNNDDENSSEDQSNSKKVHFGPEESSVSNAEEMGR